MVAAVARSAGRSLRRRWFLALLSVCLAPAAVAAQHGPAPVIRGRLIEDGTGEPIAAATVRLLSPDSAAVATGLTGEAGGFRLEAPGPGTYRLDAERLGYKRSESEPFVLIPGDTIEIEFRLAAAAIVVDPIRVTASALPWGNRFGLVRMEAFFARYARYSGTGFAEFMTRDSIARWEDRVQSTGQMLRWTMRAVRNVDPATGAVTLRSGCEPAYFLNGSPVPYAMVQPLSPTMLQAVEIYIRPAIPAEFGSGSPCGVVSYWSRQSPPEELPESPVGRIVALVALTGGLIALLLATAF